MAITAAQVKELRERTGAGMMECKKALVAAEGDIEKAVEDMRKAGQAKADKKSGRTAAEGNIFIVVSDDNKDALILEINCETDFVARDENFVAFGQQVATTALANKTSDVAQLSSQTLAGGDATIEDTRKNLVTKLGENIQLRRCLFVTADGSVANYKHGDRIGVVVALSKDDSDLGKDIAMHIAASAPTAISPDDVAQELIDKEREIFSAQALSSGKPEEIVQKMIDGRLSKFVNEVSLTGQPFVKDPSKSVGALLQSADAKVQNFVRFEVGEGIEKEETDFAKEVMEQAQGTS